MRPSLGGWALGALVHPAWGPDIQTNTRCFLVGAGDRSRTAARQPNQSHMGDIYPSPAACRPVTPREDGAGEDRSPEASDSHHLAALPVPTVADTHREARCHVWKQRRACPPQKGPCPLQASPCHRLPRAPPAAPRTTDSSPTPGATRWLVTVTALGFLDTTCLSPSPPPRNGKALSTPQCKPPAPPQPWPLPPKTSALEGLE